MMQWMVAGSCGGDGVYIYDGIVVLVVVHMIDSIAMDIHGDQLIILDGEQIVKINIIIIIIIIIVPFAIVTVVARIMMIHLHLLSHDDAPRMYIYIYTIYI